MADKTKRVIYKPLTAWNMIQRAFRDSTHPSLADLDREGRQDAASK